MGSDIDVGRRGGSDSVTIGEGRRWTGAGRNRAGEVDGVEVVLITKPAVVVNTGQVPNAARAVGDQVIDEVVDIGISGRISNRRKGRSGCRNAVGLGRRTTAVVHEV